MNLAEKSSFVKQNGHISPSDEDAPADDGQKTLTSKIVAVHVVYHSVEQHIHWFGQITFRRPGMLEVLEANSQNSPNINMVILFLVYSMHDSFYTYIFCLYIPKSLFFYSSSS